MDALGFYDVEPTLLKIPSIILCEVLKQKNLNASDSSQQVKVLRALGYGFLVTLLKVVERFLTMS